MNFCRRCGEPLSHVAKHIYECPGGHTLFANPSPTVGVFFVTPDLQVLLSVRGIQPNEGMLDAFGGFVDQDESLEAAAVRELDEELSLKPKDYEPLRYITSSAVSYLFEHETLNLMSTLYWTRLTTDQPLTPSSDVTAIKQLPLHDFDLSLLHADDIRKGIVELRQIFPKVTKQGAS
jgi:ADP-ribose pyrophosphatase YjhB (NUDIX family)